MAIIRKWSGDGLSAGTLTTSTAGTGDDSFDVISGTIDVVSTGVRAPQLGFATSSTLARVQWSTPTLTQLAARWYVTFSGAAATAAILQGLDAARVNQTFRVERITAGFLRIRDGANAQIGSDSSAAVPNGQRVRFEVTVSSAGTITATAYAGETATVLATVTASGVGTSHGAVRFGGAANVTSYPSHELDDLAVADTATEIGPAVTSALLTFPTVTATGWAVTGSNAQVALADSDDATYVRSGTNPTGLVLGPLVKAPTEKPTSNFVVTVRARLNAGTTSSIVGTLRDSSGTVIATASTVTVTSASFTDVQVVFPVASFSGTTDAQWRAVTASGLRVQLAVTAS